MREFNFVFDKGLQRGLRPTEKNPRNNQYLVEAIGAYPDEGALHATPELNVIDCSVMATYFPFPKLFKCSTITLVCGSNDIYSYDETAKTLTPLITGIPDVGGVWSCADYGPFIVLSNGKHTVHRDAETYEWKLDSLDIPQGTCVCDIHGQLFVGAPNSPYSL